MKKLININFIIDDEKNFDYKDIEDMLIQDLANLGVDVDVDVVELEEPSYDYYYQIDYIDKDGLANYIETFDKDEREKAIKAMQLLNQANMCINGTTTKFVLDYYRYKLDKDGHAIDDTDEVIEQDINEEV